MEIIDVSEVLLDGGTIEKIVTDRGLFKRDNKGQFYEWNYDRGCFYPTGYSCCLSLKLTEYLLKSNNNLKNRFYGKYIWLDRKEKF